MNLFIIVHALILTIIFQFNVVHSNDLKSQLDEIEINKRRENCQMVIEKDFGKNVSPTIRAQYAFDKYKVGMDLHPDSLAYFGDFEAYMNPKTTLEDPLQFCTNKRYSEGHKTDACVEKIRGKFGIVPFEAILKALYHKNREEFYPKLHKNTQIPVFNGLEEDLNPKINRKNEMTVFDMDLATYWDHLKYGFFLKRFPVLENFCKYQHRMPTDNKTN